MKTFKNNIVNIKNDKKLCEIIETFNYSHIRNLDYKYYNTNFINYVIDLST